MLFAKTAIFLSNSFLDLKLILGVYANSTDPVQMLQNLAPDQGLNILVRNFYSNTVEVKTVTIYPKN